MGHGVTGRADVLAGAGDRVAGCDREGGHGCEKNEELTHRNISLNELAF
jgi:hypothetical protein